MTLPSPLPDRIGYIGGIEAITLDGKCWYFGFNYSSDLVLSPLIDDPTLMAEFAARHMEQMDGRHDAAYWRELVDWSATGSQLASDAQNRTFTSAQLNLIAKDVSAAILDNTPIPGFSIPYHALYLLATAAGDNPPPDEEPFAAAMTKLGMDEYCTPVDGACEAMDMLAETKPLPAGATYTDAAMLVHVCLAALIGQAPGNWRTLFCPLTGGTRDA